MFRYQYQFFGTIVPNSDFDPTDAAERLHNAMKGIGCRKEEVLQVLATINNQQRQEAALQYASMYGRDLTHSLKSELHGDFEEVILALMMTPPEYDVRQLHHAISGFGTDEKILIEILCSRTNEQIHLIRAKYEQDYGKSLVKAVKGDTSGDFEHLLVALLQGNRDETTWVDEQKAYQDAQKLEEAGEKRLGTDESTFIKILVNENFFQLQRVFSDYEQITGHSIQEAIKSEFSGDTKEGLIALADNIQNQPLYFATELYQAMKGLGTNEKDLIRIIVSRSEIDLALIRQQYEQNYGVSLVDAIKSECSGVFCDALVDIVRGN